MLNKLPDDLGVIIASVLDIDNMNILGGASKWVLADGRAVPGSKYEAYISSSIPDLRGLFLRGKNYDRVLNHGNSEGDLKLGTHQFHQIESHTHRYIEMIGNDQIDGVDSKTVRSGDHHRAAAVTGVTGASETRPNSITVNFFICIN